MRRAEDMKPQKVVSDSEELVRRGAPRRSVSEGFLCRECRGHGGGKTSPSQGGECSGNR